MKCNIAFLIVPIFFMTSCGMFKETETVTQLDGTSEQELVSLAKNNSTCKKNWNTKRRMVSSDKSVAPGLFRLTDGMLYIYAYVDREGNVTDAQIDYENSTMKDKNYWREALAYARTIKYEEKPDAPSVDCGTVSISFIVK